MSKQLSYQPLTDVGLNGLNTQSNPATLDTSFLTKAENVVIRESGRIAFRKGLKQKIAPSGASIGSIVEHNDQGTNKIFASHGTSIYTIDFTDTDAAFPSSGANVKRTVANTTGDWQFINFNRRLHCLHADTIPQRYDGAADTGERWSAHYNATALNGAINDSVTTMTVDSTVGFPPEGKVIIESEVISYTGITATTFTGLTRSATDAAAASHADNLAVATYSDPTTVSNGEFKPSCGTGFYGRLWVGGVAEQKDVLFYSNLLDGDDWVGGGFIDLKSVWGTDDIVAIEPFFGKLVIFGVNNIAIYNSPAIIGSMALDEVIQGVGCVSRDTVQHIGEDLVFLSSTGLRSLGRTTENDKVPLQDYSVNIKDTLIRNIGQSSNIKSIYVENEGIYILSFVTANITYVFDFKHFTPNNAPRVTTWTFNNDREPTSMAYTVLYGLLVGQKDGGIAGYEGYYDSDLAANGTTVTLHASASTFKPVFGLHEYKTPLTGSAKNLKLEIDITSNGFDASLQDLTLLHKQGKIR